MNHCISTKVSSAKISVLFTITLLGWSKQQNHILHQMNHLSYNYFSIFCFGFCVYGFVFYQQQQQWQLGETPPLWFQKNSKFFGPASQLSIPTAKVCQPAEIPATCPFVRPSSRDGRAGQRERNWLTHAPAWKIKRWKKMGWRHCFYSKLSFFSTYT